MAGITGKSLALAPLVIAWSLCGAAQTTEVLPEIDTNVKLSSDLRFSFQAKDTREAGAPEQAEIGPSLDFYLKPLIRLQDATKFDLDDAKPRPLVFTIGYRPAPYAIAEFFYQSQYGKWSDTAIYVGCSFPIGKHLEFKPYYEHQNNTGKSLNGQLNQLGLILYFSVGRHPKSNSAQNRSP